MPAQRYKDYISRWKDPEYASEVRDAGRNILSDGCSGVPEFYHIVCVENDIHYATHLDYWTFETIAQEDADRYLKWGIQYFSIFGRWSPMAYWRYWALSSKKGLGLGREPWESGPERLEKRLAGASHARPDVEPDLGA